MTGHLVLKAWWPNLPNGKTYGWLRIEHLFRIRSTEISVGHLISRLSCYLGRVPENIRQVDSRDENRYSYVVCCQQHKVHFATNFTAVLPFLLLPSLLPPSRRRRPWCSTHSRFARNRLNNLAKRDGMCLALPTFRSLFLFSSLLQMPRVTVH